MNHRQTTVEGVASRLGEAARGQEIRNSDEPGPDDGRPAPGSSRVLDHSCELRRARHLPALRAAGPYVPIYPVWFADEEPGAQQFVLALDDEQLERWDHADVLDPGTQRRYADRVARVRLHQPLFRERVLVAYETRCATCQFRRRELLEAAHILADSEGGEPVVPNGIATCSLRHGAFDHALLGLRPDYRIEVRSDVLSEVDGPRLRYALQAVHGQLLHLPRSRASHPDRELVDQRYQRFLAAS